MYEERATRVVYVIPAAGSREVPASIGRMLIEAHPDKLYDADAGLESEARPADTADHDRIMDTAPGRRTRKKPARQQTRGGA